MARTVNQDQQLFFYLCVLTGFFLLLEASFFITCNRAYLSDYTHVTANIAIPASVLPGVIFFIFAEIALHVVYVILIYAITRLISQLLYFNTDQDLFFGISFWVIGISTILLANAYLFPNSRFSELIAIIFLSPLLIKIVLFPLLFLSGFIIFLAALQICFQHYYFLVMVCCSLGIIYFVTHQPSPPTQDAATRDRPNIIIIGVDSLRPDFLAYFGHDKAMPFFEDFLNDATVFSDALTPLARTFPSWTSILTGRYPHKNGVRFNLTHPSRIHLADTLPAILRNHGYHTAYTTDETRFSNIDHYFGFDEILTAPMGLNDFIVGTLNDFPLSNLLINTIIGKWLFPYSYGNRGVYFTYDPDSFLTRIKPLVQTPRSKPLFLCAHFCLPHFPNLWASARADDLTPSGIYQASVERAGLQIQEFMQILKQNNVLKHAIVVLLSDHGEGLGLIGDRITESELFDDIQIKKTVPQFYPPSLDGEEVNQSAGHGTDVLGLPQYHVVMAFKFFGSARVQHPKVITDTVTLLDIKPTLLELLGIDGDFSRDGVSLAFIMNKEQRGRFPRRHIFIESDYSPESVRTVFPETRQVMLDGIKLFEIDPITTRLTIKNDMGLMILASKQYADIYGDWMLALYPQNKDIRMPILVNLQTGQWTNDLSSQLAQNSPAKDMLKALKAFYGAELTGI